jgi:malonyl CoA-acyl carrier protein transacylase
LEKLDILNIIEIGPGKVLSGLIKRTSNKFNIKNIETIKDIEKFL